MTNSQNFRPGPQGGSGSGVPDGNDNSSKENQILSGPGQRPRIAMSLIPAMNEETFGRFVTGCEFMDLDIVNSPITDFQNLDRVQDSVCYCTGPVSAKLLSKVARLKRDVLLMVPTDTLLDEMLNVSFQNCVRMMEKTPADHRGRVKLGFDFWSFKDEDSVREVLVASEQDIVQVLKRSYRMWSKVTLQNLEQHIPNYVKVVLYSKRSALVTDAQLQVMIDADELITNWTPEGGYNV